MSAVLIMSTVTTKKCKALDDGARQEFDRAPVIPTNVIFDLILPFLYDRRTWNSICSVNKELHDDGMERTPPWPETKVYLGRSQDHGTRSSLKFSPCGSFLANGASLLSICDRRRGRITCLIGHTSSIRHLSFSKDGKYLASSGADNSIRIWPTNPTTGLPQQSDKTLLGHRGVIACLDFAPDDSNVLVSGASYDIKVWDVETEVCTHHFDCDGRWPSRYIQSMYLPLAGDKVRKCIFATRSGSLIRACWDPLSDMTCKIVDMPGLGWVHNSTFSHCGSLLAVSSTGNPVDVIIYDMKTMSVLQSVTMVDCTPGHDHKFVFSSDGKTLVFDGGYLEEIMVFQVHDLNIRRRLGEDAYTPRYSSAIAFDASCQVVASAGLDNYIRLWTL